MKERKKQTMIDRHDPLPAGAAQQFRELQERATKDALSGLLNRGTVEMYVSQRLASLPPEEKCAFFYGGSG